MPARDQKNISF